MLYLVLLVWAVSALVDAMRREPDPVPGRRRSVVTTLSRGRTRLALLSLALGGFGIGATEFVAMGLLPNIARDLLPGAVRRVARGRASPRPAR